MGLLAALNSGKTGILVSQKAVEIAGNNIANVNTPGYSRETPVFNPVPTVESGGFFVGQGVKIDQIAREHDVFLTRQIHDKLADFGEESVKSSPLAELERVFNIGEDSLAGDLDSFFDAWEQLSTNAGGEAERQIVLQRGQMLAQSFGEAVTELNGVVDNINASVESKIDAINGKLNEVAELNQRIKLIEINGQNANSDRDRRDLLVGEISQSLGAKYYEEDGMVQMMLPGGIALVQDNEAFQFETYRDTGNNIQLQVTLPNSEVDIPLSGIGGELKGLMSVRDEFIPELEGELDKLAYSLATHVNSQHQKGVGLNDATQRVFFDSPSEHFSAGYASDIAQNFGVGSMNLTIGTNASVPINIAAPNNSLTGIAAAINASGAAVTASVDNTGPADAPFRLMLSSTASPKESISLDVSGLTGGTYAAPALETDEGLAQQMAVHLTRTGDVAAGTYDSLAPAPAAQADNSNALSIVALGDQQLVNGRDTFVGHFSKVTSKVGIEANRVELAAGGADDSLVQLQNLRDGTVGVSIEEEMISLMQYQKGFEASAKFLSTIDEMLNSLLTLKR